MFLRLHGEEIAFDQELVRALEEWRIVQEAEGRRIGELIGFCNGVVPFLRNPLG